MCNFEVILRLVKFYVKNGFNVVSNGTKQILHELSNEHIWDTVEV